ncbi:ATP-binding protein [Luteibacter jiangsuensis]|uniref:ATP-binding protein n=1 Tax=Luteibacter jiangsuensis TaxID=637577 RepID=UPI0019659D8C|nr:ATP-binding protein [Luteibacter jiangsuensis]
MELTFVGSTTRIVAVEEPTQVGQARRVAQQAAVEAGFDDTDSGRVALIATELATNVLKHATSGAVHVAVVPGDGARGVDVVAIDRGPGFNLAECLADGFSTGGTRGEGLGAVSRQADVMDMYADARGSVVMARIYPKGFGRADLAFGATQQTMESEPVCGDAWAMAVRGAKRSFLVVDGLGHGLPAHEAAQAGISAFTGQAFDEPVQLMSTLHGAMAGTRGGAVAIAQYDAEAGSLRYAGIGNIAGSLATLDGSRGLASHPGIVGVQTRRAQPFDFPGVGGKLMLMWSDGLMSRWNLRDYPGLASRHPAVVTALLHRDFNRGRDDVTILAARLGTIP